MCGRFGPGQGKPVASRVDRKQLDTGPTVDKCVFVLAGIYYSDDKLLQSRIFSYSDTQRHRLGPNYLLLPVNAPKSAHHNNHHEGFMNFTHRDEEVRLLLGCCSAAAALSVTSQPACCYKTCAKWMACTLHVCACIHVDEMLCCR